MYVSKIDFSYLSFVKETSNVCKQGAHSRKHYERIADAVQEGVVGDALMVREAVEELQGVHQNFRIIHEARMLG